MPSKVNLISTWHCNECDEHGEPTDEHAKNNRAAEKHTEDTTHGTGTISTPVR